MIILLLVIRIIGVLDVGNNKKCIYGLPLHMALHQVL